uniref:DUF4817 domain-containing protein n=1 Tax=Strigamia maritima TaxID=126957 RepID=T1IKE6_STRMM
MAEHPLHELVDMVLCHARVDGNVHAACRLYRERFPGRRQPTRKTLRRAIARFLETGNVVHRPRQERPRTVTIEEWYNAVAANPHTSIRTIEKDVGVSRSSVHRILHEHNFHPFHMLCHQALEERDFQARMNFCNCLLCRLDDDPDFTTNILWSDEAQFSRNGVVNHHNAHYWAENNPRWLHQTTFQVNWRVNAWCGIYNTQILQLNAQRYTNMILNGIVLEFTDDLPLAAYQKLMFAHYFDNFGPFTVNTSCDG